MAHIVPEGTDKVICGERRLFENLADFAWLNDLVPLMVGQDVASMT
jgi:hypothetical protein